MGLGFGTDWGSLAGAWLAEWERTGDPAMLERLRHGMRTIGAQRHGFTVPGRPSTCLPANIVCRNPRPGHVAPQRHPRAARGRRRADPTHRRAGLPAGVDRLWGALQRHPGRAGRPAQRVVVRGQPRSGHSRLTTYAAKLTGDPKLAERAWREFLAGAAGYGPRFAPERRLGEGPAVPRPVEEARVSPNATAQWGLAAMQCPALVPEALPKQL